MLVVYYINTIYMYTVNSCVINCKTQNWAQFPKKGEDLGMGAVVAVDLADVD